MYGIKSEVLPWYLLKDSIAAWDQSKVEDAHSLALKTGKPQDYKFQARLEPHIATNMEGYAYRDSCKGCPKQCAIIVDFAYRNFLDDDDDDEYWRQATKHP